MKRYLWWMVPMSFLLVTGSAAWARKWSDNTGKFSVEAEFVAVEDGKVRLKKANDKIITVPIARLSGADRRYLASLNKQDQELAILVDKIKQLGGRVRVV